MSNAIKSFDILATSSSALHNYNLYLVKFLNTSAKPFFRQQSKEEEVGSTHGKRIRFIIFDY